jgi:hypothetical protein
MPSWRSLRRVPRAGLFRGADLWAPLNERGEAVVPVAGVRPEDEPGPRISSSRRKPADVGGA